MQPKSDTNKLGHRRAIFLSSTDIIERESDVYTKCLSTPVITEEYQYITLNIARISNNNIYTIQNDVNEKVCFDIEYFHVNDPIKPLNDPSVILSGPKLNTLEIKIPQNHYSGEEFLNYLTKSMLTELKFTTLVRKDILPVKEKDEDESFNYFLHPQAGDKIFDWYDKTTNRLKLYCAIYTHFGNYILTKIKMRMPNLFGRLLGSNVIDDELIILDSNPSHSWGTKEQYYDHKFLLTPSLIWCNVIQVRCSWVNNGENSAVLANIPITDISNTNITWVNPQIDWSTKKMQFHDYQKIKFNLSNEDGYAIDLTNISFQFEIIVY